MTGSKRRQTPSQTLGPFFAYGLTPGQYGYAFKSLVTPEMDKGRIDGERIRLIGQVFDGEGQPIEDAMVEIWQACQPADGRQDERSNTGLTGFARAGTGAEDDAHFIFELTKPQPRPKPLGDGGAPHLCVILTMRGLLNHLFTRIYFDDESEANLADPVLAKVPPERRPTLLARRSTDGAVYRFDIHMQGPDETVFFDV